MSDENGGLGLGLEIVTTRFVGHFKHTFEHFKHTYTHFHILFHPHVYQKYPNNITQTPLPNTPLVFIVRVFRIFKYNICIQVEFKSGMHNTCTRLEPTTGWVSKTQTRPICFTGQVKYRGADNFRHPYSFFYLFILYAR